MSLAAPALAAPPVGLRAVSGLDYLPESRAGTRTLQVSSHDPTGGNADQGNYRYAANGEFVLLDTYGPGCVYRIWMRDQDPNGVLRVYLDQSPAPAIQLTLGDFFGGAIAPILAPLVASASESSGGSTCYYPIPYRNGCRITTTTSAGAYNITYQAFPDDTGVTSYTGQENACEAQVAWQYAGLDPKIDTGTQALSFGFALPAGQASAPINLAGPGIIQGLELHLSGLEISSADAITDDGRSTLGSVSFKVAVHPANHGVRLVRRIDYGICDQHGRVYVNGALAGDWVTPGSKAGVFTDTSFDLPANLTTGQSVLNVEIQFVGTCDDWNEFYYWVYSNVGGQYSQTDYVNVGNINSEALHSYAITTQTWAGTRSYPHQVLADPISREVLNNTRLVIHWDNDAAPAVDAPLALFFGGGTSPALVQAVPVGMDTDRLYCFFPMPFASAASIQLVNDSAQGVDAVHVDLHYTPMPALPTGYGRFHAQYHSTAPAAPGDDYVFLNETGSGHLVGVVQAIHGAGADRAYLEGDERIYVDGRLTPAIYGTGTDAFFNGGGYFEGGTFTLPVSGQPVHDTGDGDTTIAYRFFLSDAIPFVTSIRAGIEHGPANDAVVDMASVAFYYRLTDSGSKLTDQLDVGATSSESAHGYQPLQAGSTAIRTDTYEGDQDTVSVTDHGRQQPPSGGGATFNLTIAQGSRGVLLRRRMDYAVPNQAARVYVNGALAGTWYDAGSNTTHRWRDSEFLLAPALVAGKKSLAIRIENASATSDWTEFHYWVYSIDVPPTPADFDGDGDVDMEDFGRFQICFTATFGEVIPPECAAADLDGNTLINQADFALFFNCFSGPNQPVDPGC